MRLNIHLDPLKSLVTIEQVFPFCKVKFHPEICFLEEESLLTVLHRSFWNYQRRKISSSNVEKYDREHPRDDQKRKALFVKIWEELYKSHVLPAFSMLQFFWDHFREFPVLYDKNPVMSSYNHLVACKLKNWIAIFMTKQNRINLWIFGSKLDVHVIKG